MIGRADIEGSKSDVAMNAWPPQASYPCGNFSDTSGNKFHCWDSKGSIGHALTVCIRTENQNQMSFYPFVLQEISVLFELIFGHLRYGLADVPPQPNSPPDCVLDLDHGNRGCPRCTPRFDPRRTPMAACEFHLTPEKGALLQAPSLPNRVSKISFGVVVFQD
jgi:hypothetical protein